MEEYNSLLETVALETKLQNLEEFVNNFQFLCSKLPWHICEPFAAHQCATAHWLKMAALGSEKTSHVCLCHNSMSLLPSSSEGCDPDWAFHFFPLFSPNPKQPLLPCPTSCYLPSTYPTKKPRSTGLPNVESFYV